MAKEDIITLTGVVEEVLPNAMFRVKINENHRIIAVVSGKIRQHRIHILANDKVRVELSPYDLTRGRISYRER